MVVVVLRITRGYSPEYLLKEVATGRENYYTGAVADGRAAGPVVGRRRGAARPDAAWSTRRTCARCTSGSSTRAPRGSTTRPGGTRCPPSATPAAGTCPRTSCTPPRLNASRTPRLNAGRSSRTEAGKTARHNVAFFDVTFNVQKSVTLLHTAFEAQEVAARSAGRRGDRAGVGGVPAGGRGRDLGGQQRRARLPRRERRLLPGRAPRRRRGPVGRRPRLGRGVVLPARLPRPRPAPAHPQRRCSTGCRARTGCGAPSTGAALFRWRPAAAAVAERTDRGAAHPRARGAGRDAPGREGPRGRRGRPGGDGPDLHPAPASSPRRPRSWSRRSRPATAAPRTGWSASGCCSRPRC